MNIKKNKIGADLAFGVIVGIILTFLAGGVILAVVKNTASGAEESTQVGLCRTSNEINYGYIEEKTSGLVSGPQICTTIDKTKKGSQIPTKDYPQTKEGAESEIREMIKNCWYMWLEGSYNDMFHKMPMGNGCFTCYTFKVEDDKNIGKITLDGIEESMNEPFFAVPDEGFDCSGDGGVFRDECESDEIATQPKDPSEAEGRKCCIKDIKNECENKGGICSSTRVEDGIHTKIYNEWLCPKRDQNCYVNEDNEYSYLGYIREYGQKGGNIYFIPPDEDSEAEYDSSGLYAISFVSPNGKFCLEDVEDADAPCIATFAVGGAAVGGTIAGIVIHRSHKAAAAKLTAELDELWRADELIRSGVVEGTGDDLKYIAEQILIKKGQQEALKNSKRTIPRLVTKVIKGVKPSVGKVIKGGIIISVVVGFLDRVGVLDNIVNKITETIASPITVEDPNFIIVSTQEYAQEVGCTIDYGE